MRYLTLKEAAKIAGCVPRTVQQWLHDEPKAFRTRRTRQGYLRKGGCINPVDFEKYLECGEPQA